MFSSNLTKGNNFCDVLLASLTKLSKKGVSSEGRILLLKSKLLPERVDPYLWRPSKKRGKSARVASPESVFK